MSREREREMGMLTAKSAAAAASATKMVRYMNEFKFTRSVAFALELQRRYRLAGGRRVLRTSCCIRPCQTLSAVMHLLMLCVCGKDRLYHVVAHTTTKIVTAYVSLKNKPKLHIKK